MGGLPVHGEADGVFARDDIFDGLPPQLPCPFDECRGHIEHEGRIVLLQDGQGVGEIVLIGIVKAEDDEGAALGGRGKPFEGFIE